MSELEFLKQLYEKNVETVLEKNELPAGSSTNIDDCGAIFLQFVKTLALTIQVRYHSSATKAVRVHVKSSPMGGVYDDEDYAVFDAYFAAGKRTQKTVLIHPDVMYVKVVVENLDTSYPAYDVRVVATY